MSKKFAEILMVIGLLVWTCVYVIGTLKLGPPISEEEPGPSLFPWFVIIVMVIGCLGVLYEIRGQTPPQERPARSSIKRPLLGCVALAAFIGLFFYVGYWLSSVFLCFCTAYLFEYETEKKKKAVLISAAIAMSIAIVGYLFYHVLFHIRFPEGVLL
ncbi:tripartite tricarboxylate transporter TctB family protein [Planctomycetota bacterium]